MPFQVPFRRVELEGGSSHFDLYDTSGPQVCPWTAHQMPCFLNSGCLRGPHTFGSQLESFLAELTGLSVAPSEASAYPSI